jgi:integrase
MIDRSVKRQTQETAAVFDDEPRVPERRGDPIDPSAFRRHYKAAINQAKLRPLPFHDLRHTFGSIVDVQA